MISSARFQAAIAKATQALMANRNSDGHWTGELSSSALSTATAVVALAVSKKNSPDPTLDFQSQISAGLEWLAKNANSDGGWGDTTKSLSNLSTTALCWAAFGAVNGADEKYRGVVQAAECWLMQKIGASMGGARLLPLPMRNEWGEDRGEGNSEQKRTSSPQPSPPSDGGEGENIARWDRRSLPPLISAIIARYGNDRTFSVPILTMCALSGRLGEGPEAWRDVLPLPFELAALPRKMFGALGLPVVSYALPALIAIGQARHFHWPSKNPLAKAIRNWTRNRTLNILQEIQPDNGGFLEATPLTSFVVMSLAGSGQANHSVTKRGLDFLLRSQRGDGSWPIDTNLATWLTTLSLNALNIHPSDAEAMRNWILRRQFRSIHSYTNAAPGGWAWTDLPGGVPDADDTAGALLALRRLEFQENVQHSTFNIQRSTSEAQSSSSFLSSIEMGLVWLLNLQNRDGGIPTFCRGWGKLPFDRSSPDLTAHAMLAWRAWFKDVPALQNRISRALARAEIFLQRTQRKDGAWSPLWFGNEFAPNEENLTYGTSRVVLALAENSSANNLPMLKRGVGWLLSAQNAEGGWSGFVGGPASVEETAWAVEALSAIGEINGKELVENLQPARLRGVNWLVEKIESGEWKNPTPIGFYFAKLWYYEKLYPQIFTVAALRRAAMSRVVEIFEGS